MARGNFDGKGASHCKVLGHSAVISAKAAKPIEMPLELWARMVPRNHVLNGVQIPPWEGPILGKVAPMESIWPFYRDRELCEHG